MSQSVAALARADAIAATAPALELCGVRKTYPGGVEALRSIDLTIACGELVAIAGPSGSGKSARALLGRPAIVFADEPTGNLDSRAGADLIALLHELNEDGTTIVVITHESSVAASMNRQVTMRDGLISTDSGKVHTRWK
jgi:ABC-type lipoprotein export system ATPase subunit